MKNHKYSLVWGTNGTLVKPPATKLNAGWGNEKPLHTHYNWILNKNDANLKFAACNGGAFEWEAELNYIVGAMVIGSDGRRYKALKANTGVDPVGDTTETWAPPASSVPLGTIAIWGSANPPKGWVVMAAQSTVNYPAEIAAIFGSTLPETRGEFIRAWVADKANHPDSGRGIRTYQKSDIKGHSHTATASITFTGRTFDPHTHSFNAAIWQDPSHSCRQNTGGRGKNQPDKHPHNITTDAPGQAISGSITATASVDPGGSGETRVANIAMCYIVFVGG